LEQNSRFFYQYPHPPSYQKTPFMPKCRFVQVNRHPVYYIPQPKNEFPYKMLDITY